jgi:hypothetical protein
VRDKIHFFGTTESTKTHEYFTVATGKPLLYGSEEGTFQGGNDSHIFLGRIDSQLKSGETVFYRYSRQKSTEFCSGCGGTTSSFGTDVNVPGYTNFVGYTAVLSNRLLNEFAFLYAESNQQRCHRIAHASNISTETGVRLCLPSFIRAAPARASSMRQFRDARLHERQTLVEGGGGISGS